MSRLLQSSTTPNIAQNDVNYRGALQTRSAKKAMRDYMQDDLAASRQASADVKKALNHQGFFHVTGAKYGA